MTFSTSKKGFGLVEVIIGSAVLSASLLGISGFFQTILKTSRATEATLQADYLLEEGVESVKLFRDLGYTTNIKNMSTSTTYYFSWDGSKWVATTTPLLIDSKYERTLTFADVNRDVNSDIATVGTYEPNVKRATVSVSWWNPAVSTTTRSIQTYITNLFEN
ncbi:MAG: hypothetical protein WAZ40_02610 [Minisyncoccia bacterium]